MATFTEIVASRVGSQSPAPCVLELKPGDFASDWQNRPVRPVEIGLRLPSEDDVQTARIAADRHVAALELKDAETATHAWNDALMAFAVARSVCDPRNVLAEHPILPMAEDTIQVALTSVAIRRLFDAVERLTAEQSPLARELDDDDLMGFAGLIMSGAHRELTGAAERTFRRFAGYCLDLMPETED